MSRARRRTWAEMREEMVTSPARAVATLYRRFQAAANEAYEKRGWADASLSHVQFLTETDEEGTRLTDIALSLGTTKQYAGRLARDAESKGFITLAADPADARAVLAKPTSRGRAFFEDACDVRAELETEFLSKLSATRRAAFVAMLDDLIGITR